MPGTWIQHLVEKNAAEFIRILEEGGRLYLCEDGSKLSSEVEYALVLAYRKKYGAEKQEAEQWLEKLQSSGRYSKDIWVGIQSQIETE